MAKRTKFGELLERELAKRGWSQTDLASAATKHLPEGKSLDRQRISSYINDGRVPTSKYMIALAEALGLPIKALHEAADADFDAELFEDAHATGTSTAAQKTFNLTLTGTTAQKTFNLTMTGATARLRFDMELPADVALKIVALIAPL